MYEIIGIQPADWHCFDYKLFSVPVQAKNFHISINYYYLFSTFLETMQIS